jgi:beta-lactamase superfamily II metal-dependent hydrolase
MIIVRNSDKWTICGAFRPVIEFKQVSRKTRNRNSSQKGALMAHLFVDLPLAGAPVYLLDAAGKKFRQVLWGDWLTIDDDDDGQSAFVKVRWAWNSPEKRQELKIERKFTTATRPLEIVFVDVGQGDGSVLITPERDVGERIIVIDAGEGDHMHDFLTGRFNSYKKKSLFHAAVITHPDEDHYGGFQKILASDAIQFNHLYHSGLVERPGGGQWEKLGGKTGTSPAYLELVEDHAGLVAAFDPAIPGTGKFAAMIRTGLANGSIKDSAMLSTQHGHNEDGRTWMPGFAPSDGRGYTLELLGPFVENGTGGKKRLRVIGDYGKTKNGHSVLLRLNFNNFRVLFGGDLNLPAEKFLLMQYAGLTKWPTTSEGRETMIAAAKPFFRAEVMKVCHHGASDVTDEFLAAVNPAAFVISSGDKEGHVHPRPDLLGRLGRAGRGASPVLLSTELQRSTRDKEDVKLVEGLRKAVKAQTQTPTADREQKILADVDRLGRSNVDVDGAIYVKTDGERLITAFKKETGSATDKWFYFEYSVKDGKLIMA